MPDTWPMIAGIGAGVAAAAAVGQMIVASVALGSQDATGREVADLKRKLEDMERRLAQKGYTAETTPEAIRAKQQVESARSFRELVSLHRSLEEKIEQIGDTADEDMPREKPQKKDRLTRYMEERGRRELPF